MSLRTKSRIPASTSETAAKLLSISVSVDSVFSERMEVIGYVPFAFSERLSPHDEVNQCVSLTRNLTASRPICGDDESFPRQCGSLQHSRFHAPHAPSSS